MKGGDIIQFTWAGREFAVVSEADVEVSLPGFDVENKAAGNGKMYGIGKRRLGGLDGVEVVIDHDRGDHEFLTEKQSTGLAYPATMTYAGGHAYAGALALEGGEIKYKTASGTAPLSFRGEKWEQV